MESVNITTILIWYLRY